ncbi:MAG TPA: hypothetical protein VGR16_08015, partial [Thermomicrobiales bacterium]|nr:hypothetical protein [Thermomicrobiales bacterium]
MSVPPGNDGTTPSRNNATSLPSPDFPATDRRYWAFRLRIAIPFVLLIAAGMLLLGLLLSQLAREVYVQRLTVELHRQARLISEVIAPLDTSSLEATVQRLGNASDSRITIIRADGVVLADSERDPATMGNHANRVEVRQALEGAVGSDERRSV